MGFLFFKFFAEVFRVITTHTSLRFFYVFPSPDYMDHFKEYSIERKYSFFSNLDSPFQRKDELPFLLLCNASFSSRLFDFNIL